MTRTSITPSGITPSGITPSDDAAPAEEQQTEIAQADTGGAAPESASTSETEDAPEDIRIVAADPAPPEKLTSATPPIRPAIPLASWKDMKLPGYHPRKGRCAGGGS